MAMHRGRARPGPSAAQRGAMLKCSGNTRVLWASPRRADHRTDIRVAASAHGYNNVAAQCACESQRRPRTVLKQETVASRSGAGPRDFSAERHSCLCRHAPTDIFVYQATALAKSNRRNGPTASTLGHSRGGGDLVPQRSIEHEGAKRHDRRHKGMHGTAKRPTPNAPRAKERRQEDQEEQTVNAADDADGERLIGEVLQRHRDEQQHEERRALEQSDESKVAQRRQRRFGFSSRGRGPSECLPSGEL